MSLNLLKQCVAEFIEGPFAGLIYGRFLIKESKAG